MSNVKKVNLNSVNDLRTALDDKLPSILSSIGFIQDFKLIDTKLALGYSSVIVAGLCYFVDKKYGFAEAYNVTFVSVVIYALLSGFIYYLTTFVEKDTKYIGYDEKNEKIIISTTTTKYNPIYNITINLNGKTLRAKKEFMDFFDTFGYLQHEIFGNYIKDEIKTINHKTK